MIASASMPLADVIRNGMLSGLHSDPDLNVSEWADQYRQLNRRSSPEPGPWRTDRTPYLREIMDALSPYSRVETVVVMAGSQLGKTESGFNWLGYIIHLAPGPIMMVMPTLDTAERQSKQRIAPLIEDTGVLKERIFHQRKSDGGNTLLSKEFPGGILILAGANSAKALRSMPVRYLVLDEVDAYPGDVEGEGDPCMLAMARTSNFPRRKVLITSTPLTSGRSRIERFYEESDQRQLWLPCPHCGEMIVLAMEHLRWPPGRPQQAKYYCEACAKPIENHQKNWMLPRCEWRPRVAGDGKTRGYHLPSLNSPVGWLSWGQIADKREKAGKDPEKIKVFVNTVLGLPYADEAEVPDAERLFERREGYQIGVVPKGGLVLTAGVDVQVRRLEVEIVAWGPNKESWSVDYRRFDGETNQPQVWAHLAELLDEEFPTEYGGKMLIRRMAIDSGFNTMSVYDFVRKQQRQRVIAVKGVTRVPAIVGAPSLIEVGPGGHKVKYGIRLWPVNVNIAKEELYRWLRQPAPDLSRGEKWPTGYCHFPSYNKEYFEQLTAEHLVTRTLRGRRISSWELVRDRNEALDARIYARAAAATLRMESWKPERWSDIETQLSNPNLPTPLPAAAASAPRVTTPMPVYKPAARAKTDWLE